jgi:hypothetical protein
MCSCLSSSRRGQLLLLLVVCLVVLLPMALQKQGLLFWMPSNRPASSSSS